MRKLYEPYEVMKIGEGESLQIQVKSYAHGEIEVLPTGTDQTIPVEVLRLNMESPLVEGRPSYLDITSGQLKVLLLPLLHNLPVGGRIFRITRQSVNSSKDFLVEVLA